MKIKKFNNFQNESKSVLVSKHDVNDILDRTSGKNLTNVDKNRLRLSVDGDVEISDIINNMASITQQFGDTNTDIKNNMSDPQPDYETLEMLKKKWLELNKEMVDLESSLRDKYGLELGSSELSTFMSKERPDVY